MGVSQRQSGQVPGCDRTGSVLRSSGPRALPEPGGWGALRHGMERLTRGGTDGDGERRHLPRSFCPSKSGLLQMRHHPIYQGPLRKERRV